MSEADHENSKPIAEAPSPPESASLKRRGLPQDIDFGRRWNRMPAWLISTIFHICMFMLLVVLWQPIRRGTGGEANRPVGIAMVRQTNAGTEFYLVEGGEGDSDTNNQTAAAAAAAAQSLPNADGPPIELDSILESLGGGENANAASGDTGEATGGTGLSGSGAASVGKGAPSKSSTSFLGVEGTGNSFVYVLDRSESMTSPGGAPMATAKRELANSLISLPESAQFQIVFYNDAPTPFRSTLNGAAGLLFARKAEKERAAEFVRQVVADGGTDHLPAIKLGMKFAPDVLFFLTDASEPSPSRVQMAEITRRCESAGTTIHCIEFGNGPQLGSGGWIESLATNTGGTYRYVDVTDLQK